MSYKLRKYEHKLKMTNDKQKKIIYLEKIRKYGGVDIGTLCSICHEDFTTTDNVCVTSCSHIYHIGCLQTWLSANNNCPLCREIMTIQNKFHIGLYSNDILDHISRGEVPLQHFYPAMNSKVFLTNSNVTCLCIRCKTDNDIENLLREFNGQIPIICCENINDNLYDFYFIRERNELGFITVDNKGINHFETVLLYEVNKVSNNLLDTNLNQILPNIHNYPDNYSELRLLSPYVTCLCRRCKSDDDIENLLHEFDGQIPVICGHINNLLRYTFTFITDRDDTGYINNDYATINYNNPVFLYESEKVGNITISDDLDEEVVIPRVNH